jgi:tRNA A-37 threonylcarbamoyl transferase component Bud32
MMNFLANVDAVFARPESVMVKDQRKIRVARVPPPTAEARTAVYIKRYNAFSLRYRIQSLFCRSGALRALRGAAILRQAQIATAEPVAGVEVRRWGMLESSFYVTEEIIAATTADAYWRERLRGLAGALGCRARRRFLTDLGRLFRRLHSARIYHNDLKDFNILVREDPNRNEEFFVLDLEGVRRCRTLSARRRVKNLVQLNRTLGRLLSRTEKLRFLKAYLVDEPASQAALALWAKKILSASRKADRLSLAKNRMLQKRASG